jgi:type I restriction enzyme S subunit
MSQLDDVTGVASPLATREFAAVSKGYTVFRDQDILVAKITPCFENGKIGKAVLDEAIGVGSTEFHVVRPGPDLDGGYLLHFLRRPEVRETGQVRMTGSGGQRRVPAAFLRLLNIPLPPLEEQRRIAAILDRADALRAKRRQVLAHLDSLTPAIFASMFGRGRDILDRWSVDRLEDQLDFLTSGSRGWAKYYGASGAKFLRIQNVQSDRLHLKDLAHVSPPATAEARRTRVAPGDVLLSITADLGRTGVVPCDIGVAHINQHLCILRSSTMNPRFLSAFLSSPSGQLQMASKNRAAVKAGLNFDDVRSLMIPVPSEELQRTFARRAERVDSQRALLARSVAGDHRLFVSLQARAFRGEL